MKTRGRDYSEGKKEECVLPVHVKPKEKEYAVGDAESYTYVYKMKE